MPSLRTRAAVRDAALTATACAALTLPDPARLGPRRLHLLRLGSAAVAGWAGWRAAQDTEVPFVAPKALGATAGAAAALALAPVEEATDRWLEAGLRRAGVGHPRAVMALASAGLGALAWATDPRRDPDDELVPVRDLYHENELDPALRQILRAMLQAGDPQTVPVALAQLDSARAQVGEQLDSTVMFMVDPGLPLVVPHTQRWPVNARWHIGEHPVVMFLQLHQGRLDHVSLMPDEGHYPHDVNPFEVVGSGGHCASAAGG